MKLTFISTSSSFVHRKGVMPNKKNSWSWIGFNIHSQDHFILHFKGKRLFKRRANKKASQCFGSPKKYEGRIKPSKCELLYVASGHVA
jgi:hypothetical protein